MLMIESLRPLRVFFRACRSPQSISIAAALVILGFGGQFIVKHVLLRNLETEITDRTRSTATFLAASFERRADTVEAIIDKSIRKLAALPEAKSAQEFLEGTILPSPILQLTLVSTDGSIVASSLDPTTSVHLIDREQIRMQMEDRVGLDEMVVSVPVLGQISGRWTVHFSKALRGPKSASEGVLVASLAIEDFIDIFSSFPMYEGTLIALRRFDGVELFSSVIGGQNDFGNVVPWPELDEAFRRFDSQGVAFALPNDGVERVGWARVVKKYPLYLLVAEPRGVRMDAVWVYQLAWWLLVAGTAATGFSLRQYYLNAMLRERLETGRRTAALARLTSLGELAAGLSHEIGTPANTILLAIGNLKRSLEAGEATKDSISKKLDRIEASAIRIRVLMEAVRGHVRSGSEADTCDPAAAMRNALALVGQQLHLAGIEVAARIEPCGVVALTSSALETVFINLLINARDAIRDRDPELKRIAIACVRQGDVVRINVEDTGGGVSTALREKIFEPFFTTKKLGEGTGIGLSTSWEIIHSAAGSIAVENTADGARFTVSIPTMSAVPDATADPTDTSYLARVTMHVKKSEKNDSSS